MQLRVSRLGKEENNKEHTVHDHTAYFALRRHLVGRWARGEAEEVLVARKVME